MNNFVFSDSLISICVKLVFVVYSCSLLIYKTVKHNLYNVLHMDIGMLCLYM